MKWFKHSVLLLFLLIPGFGCAHSPHSGSSSTSSGEPPPYEQVVVASSPDPIPLDSPEVSPKYESGKTDNVSDSPAALASPEIPSNSDNMNLDYVEEEKTPEKAGIADPLEPFNRAMFHFNDKLYFWALKPVAQGYGKVVPEVARVGVRNFFSNIASPIRIVNCVLQARFVDAVKELGRFAVNTVWGIGGLMDLASDNAVNLPKQDADFGQTLGVYGLGQGFYINWPIWGPSSPRDTVGLIGDAFLHPFTYLCRVGRLDRHQGVRNGECHILGDRRLRVPERCGRRSLRGVPGCLWSISISIEKGHNRGRETGAVGHRRRDLSGNHGRSATGRCRG